LGGKGCGGPARGASTTLQSSVEAWGFQVPTRNRSYGNNN